MSGSSLQEGRIVRSDEITSEEREQRRADTIKRLDAMTDDDIDYSDIPKTDFSNGKRGRFYRPPEGQVMLPIDHDLMAWFRETNTDYLTAINAALREHVSRERAAKSDH